MTNFIQVIRKRFLNLLFVISLLWVQAIHSQAIDSLAYYDQSNNHKNLKLILGEVDQLTPELAYYLIKSYNLYLPSVALVKTDSVLGLPFYRSSSYWEERALALRLSFVRKSGGYEEVIRKGRDLLSNFKDSIGRFDVAHNMCISYRRMDQYDSAMSLGISLIRLSERLKDPLRKHRALQNMANLHAALKEYRKAKNLEHDLIVIADNLNNADLMILDRSNIASTYMDLGRYDSARYFFEQAIEIAEYTNEKKRVPLILYNKSSLEYREENYRQAIPTLELCIARAKELGQPTILVRSKYLLALCYHKLKDFDNVAGLVEDGIKSAALFELRQDKLYFIELKADLMQRNGNYEQAIALLKSVRQLEDSILNEDKFKSIQELEMRFQTERKEQKITNLQQENSINQLLYSRRLIILLSLIMIMILSAGLFFIIVRSKQIKVERQKLLTEQQLLRSQMNPHFLYNALASINSFIFKGDKYQASEYLTTFSDLTRKILTYSSKEWVTLAEELDLVKQYLDIQKLRFSNIVYHIDCPEELSELLVPPLLLQPFVENSIVHGFAETNGGEINIKIEESTEEFSITIKDNGKGLSGKKKGSSKALQIANDRIRLLYGEAKKYNIALENSAPEPGVTVRLTLPVKEAL